MGTRTDPGDGILVPIAETLTIDAITDTYSGTATTALNTASQRAGLAVAQQDGSRLVPRLHGRQSLDALLQCVSAGTPGLSRGVELAWRPYDDTLYTDAHYAGWAPPIVPSFWSCAYWSTTTPNTGYAAAVHPDGGIALVVVYSGGQTAYVVRPNQDASYTYWTAATTDPATTSESALAMCCLPSGRLMLFNQSAVGSAAYYSDDAGVNWDQAAKFIIPSGVPASLGPAQAAYLNGAVLWVVRKTSTSADLVQMASANDGTTFDLVETASTICGTGAYDAVSVVSTGKVLLVGYCRNADAYAAVVILGSAYDPISTGVEVALTSAAASEIQLCAEEDGLCWAFIRLTTAPAKIQVYVSYDHGATWTQMSYGAFTWGGSSNDLPRQMLPVATAGYVCLLHSWLASTSTTDGSVAGLWLGGWSNVVPSTVLPLHDSITERIGLGPDNTGAGGGATCYLPMELPENVGAGEWTHTAAGGTVALATPGVLSVVTVAAADYYTLATGTAMGGVYVAQVDAISGGSVSSDTIAWRVRVANATNDYDVTLRFSYATNQIRLVDNNNAGATLTTASMAWQASTNGKVFCLEKGTSATWTLRYRGVRATRWTEVWSGNSTNDNATPNANGLIEFGGFAAAAGSSQWFQVWYSDAMSLYDDVDTNLIGRPISAIPVPIPVLGGSGSSDTTVARLSAIDGPGVYGEEWLVQAASDYPHEAMLAGVSPSPDVGWRSSGTAVLNLDFDLGADTYLGPLAVVVLNHNLLSFNLQLRTDGGGSWTSQGVAVPYLGFSTLQFDRTGLACRPSATTTKSGRYIKKDELKGGYLYDITAGKSAKIAGNKAGWWSDDTESVCEVILEDATGISTLNADCALVPPSCIFYPQEVTTRARYIRFQVPASLVVPAGETYRIGKLLICRIHALGRDAAWGGGYSIEGNTSVQRSRYGTTRATQQGPNVRRWRLSFTDGHDMLSLRTANSSGIDYRGPSSGTAYVATEDSVWQLEGIYQETLAGEIPVVAVHELPTSAAATTYNEAALWCYGRLLGPITATIPTGYPGTDEVIRLDPIEIDPIA